MRKSLLFTTTAATAAIACLSIAPAQATASHAGHGFGLDVSAAIAHEKALGAGAHTMGSPQPLRTLKAAATPPSSYSLEQYALSPGDQGQVGACVTWATGYTGYGILMNEQGISGDPMAPMYIYSQIVKGDDVGTTASVALPMMKDQGIDTKSDYTQGDFDYTTQPTDAERANAAHYKLSGSTDLSKASDKKTAVENAISSGLPVAIGFEVRSSFEDLDTSNYTYDPSDSEDVLGGHEVTIVGYDADGLTIENSWGTSWGNKGYFKAPWSFLDSDDVIEIHSMGKLVPTD